MLRFDHMPSDFHPLFLFLGEHDDLAALAALLRDFESEPREIDVRDAIPGTGGRAHLKLIPGEGLDAPYGLRQTDVSSRFTWMLNAWQAGQIAARIDLLTPLENKSGNDIFELGIDGEIPIKVSRGEFTDNFLTPRHHLDPDYDPAAPDASS